MGADRRLLGPSVPRYGSVDAPSKKRFTEDLRLASFASRLLFSYAEPLMAEAATRQLSTDELWALDGQDEATEAYRVFKRAFESSTSVGAAILKTYGWRIFACGMGELFAASCVLFAPVVLHHVVDALTTPQALDVVDLSQWLGVFFASRLLSAVVASQAQFLTEIVSMQASVALKALLFDKVLRSTSTSTEGDTAGADIVNLYTTDVMNLLWAAFQINSVWVMPLQITAVIYMLYSVIGVAAFAGLAMIGLSMAASFVIAMFTGKAYMQIMERKDARMRLMKEVFGAIQVVKLNAWEPKFSSKIAALRSTELRAVARYLYLGAASTTVLWGSPLFVSMTSFAVYSLVMGHSLTAAKVFTSLALFNAIRDPLQTLPTVIQQCIQAKVSLNRIEEYLNLDEVDQGNVVHDDPSQPADIAVSVQNSSFVWVRAANTSTTSPTEEAEIGAKPILKNVNLDIRQGDFVVIEGSVGAGKSSLCSALLGDMHKLSGSVLVRGRVAYYSQQPWIQNMTLRDNILFGSEYDPVRYQRVLDACCLLPDLDQLPGRDLTEIGQKGVNLSGGQKARVCLARACYADADVLILDSPLAAVDTVVQGEIFRKCICGLLREKTVLLVTHIPDILASSGVNCRITVEDKKIDFVRRVDAAPRSSLLVEEPRINKKVDSGDAFHSAHQVDAGKFVEEEDRFEGRVSVSVFLQYLRATGGFPVCLFILVIQGLWQALQVCSDLWLSHWTGHNGEPRAYDFETASYYLSIYAALGLASVLMVVIRAFAVPRAGLRASRTLFDGMNRAMLKAPLHFFDSNPIGRIMNRFGDDIASVDFGLPTAFSGTLASAFFTATQLATAVYMVNFLGVLVLPLVFIYVRVASFYLVPSRESSRLWKVSSSPVLSYISETEQGVTVLRAFGSKYVERAVAENFTRINAVNRVWYVFTVTAQWFQLRMQLIGCGVIIVVVSALIYLREVLSPGLVGLAFTYALSVDAGLAVLVRWWGWIEIAMVSPERILEYTAVPSEGMSSVVIVEPAEQWPARGTLIFDQATFRYTPEGSDILKAVSFEIGDREKIGIVGRTGAGKSSLTMALFRTTELVSGRILIDGIDIASVPLQTLRSRLSIIPQSPVLFKGSLRAFMDPFDEFTDADLWSALEKVDLKARIRELDGQLSYELAENGDNFSVGERQLMCMARAVLKQTRIVIMDEATASIDHATERKLQEMIVRDFGDATVITIAHRLATVMAADRILVLHGGCVVEFDTPQRLLAKSDGMFSQLAKEGGY